MVYLEKFSLLTKEQEDGYFKNTEKNLHCYSSAYPFCVFHRRELPTFVFGPVTIFYGGNGSGKSTLLNVMAQKLNVSRGAVYNRTDFFNDYVRRCRCSCALGQKIPAGSRIITSDDVFDYMLDVRCINAGIDTERARLMKNYTKYRMEPYPLKSLDDYDEWRRRNDAKEKRPNVAKYVCEHLMDSVPGRSNGETALMYFTETVKEKALYLLDEPENSLSPSLQLELKLFLEDSARFFGCQLVISTHSPFLLSISGARVYDLDAQPVRQRRWTELENVQIYREFFAQNEGEFLPRRQ